MVHGNMRVLHEYCIDVKITTIVIVMLCLRRQEIERKKEELRQMVG